MRIELKSLTSIINILEEQLDMIPCHMNGSSETTQGHDENIQPTPHHLKWVPVNTKYQGKKRNSTTDQLNSNVLRTAVKY